MAAHVPGVLFMLDGMELGLLTLMQNGLVPEVPTLPPMQNWNDVLTAVEALRSEEHNFRALAIDAISGIGELCRHYVCQRDFKGSWPKYADWSVGDRVNSPVEWRTFLAALDRLRTERRMSIMLLGHAQTKNVKGAGGKPDSDRNVVDFPKEMWSVTERWADLVLFADYEMTFDDPTKKKSKVHGGETRMIYTENRAEHTAKNRHGLPPEIEMGDSGLEAWNNLSAALKAGRKAVAA